MSKPNGSRPQSGFATIIILMLLFMMLMLAITYLRVMRAYSLTHPQLVANADQILVLLESDIAATIGADGKIGPTAGQTYYPAPAPFAANTYLQADSNIQEPYDYPWTNTLRSANDCRLAYPQVQTSKLGMGDPRTDDSWLAPIEPEGPAGSQTWPQVSNVAGSFLVYGDASLSSIPANGATREFVPSDAPAGAAIANLAQGQSVAFQNLPTTDPRLVDTDGDGVGDALWFYPRNNLIGGLRYVAAVRIVDLSAMVNLNTALGELAASPGSPAPKGEGPYEINPASANLPAGSRLGFPAMTAASKLFRVPGYVSAPAAPLAAGAGDYGFWMQSGGQAGADGQTIPATVTKDPVTGDRSGIRYTLDDEMQVRDFSNKFARNWTPKPMLFDCVGASPAHAGHYGSMPSADVRKRVTTISGAQDRFAPFPYTGNGAYSGAAASNTFTGYTRRAGDLGLNQADATGTKRVLTNSAAMDSWWLFGGAGCAVEDLFMGMDASTPNDDYPFPEGFKLLVPVASSRPREFSIQAQYAIADALDRNNMPTVAGNWMGWKPLPILTEFYAQMPYFIGLVNHNNGSTSPNWNVYLTNTTSSRSTGDSGLAPGWWPAAVGKGAGVGAYAFELANPYAIPIRLANVRFRFKQGDSYTFASPSVDLGTLVASSGMAKDAEGFYVLKPGECVVFYRNGTENPLTVAGVTKPFGGQADISGAITGTAGSGVYKVDLGTGGNAPDINNYSYANNTMRFELEVACKGADGGNATGNYAWLPVERLSFPALNSGAANYWYEQQAMIPSSQTGAVGNLVYKQVDVRTFGVAEKLNLLQARPPALKSDTSNPVDWGDFECRSNLYVTGSGLLATPYPDWNNYVYANTSATMPLKSTAWQYDATLSSLGQSVKVSFPGPSGGNAMYAGGRQNIQNGDLFWNYVGIPSDANYPGTFPELMSSPTGPWTSATNTPRDNAKATNNGPQRRDGMPHVMDLRKVLLAGPIYDSRVRGSFEVGNSTHRGDNGSGWNWNFYYPQPTIDQLVASWSSYAIGDAINFHLCKDRQANGASARGIKALCLRDDLPFYDSSKIVATLSDGVTLTNQTLTQLYSLLAARQAMLDAVPVPPVSGADPNAASRALYTCDVATLNAAIRGQMFWTISWADVFCQHFQVDSPKYKGKTANNGDDFKPGTININTASAAVLGCLSLPNIGTSGFTPANFVNGIVAARKNPANAAAANNRQGLAMVGELMDQGAAPFGLTGADAGSDLFTAVSWLPQQATCRSDVFCAHIVLQGYKQDDFNAGPLDVRRAIVFYKRDTSGSPAVILGKPYMIPNQ